ncbi:Fe-S cluster assembly protein SufD [Bradyrhizobium sp. USDA 4532]|uniref:Fe-S cluster assembly protein SufD n=1 Tax=unclassified Bradyrhizobium TaxID=2631580 RepID=UPI00209F142B|nr:MULTISPECIES: Fe-S cluster assembly protein SufD [unclassified Bradyrhizobium]MCP1835846.1 Fe-S cluster assembly protein SufD [Bradyrhizobium sp. USDA 4545]MCP1920594.1 Fe-S cluster assembly protein SufD [Bradyrhizobium sp. USDA 4532]
MKQVLAKADAGCATSNFLAAALGRLPGAGIVPHIRARAFEAYERAGLPHRRMEAWRYTDLRALIGEVLPLAPRPDAAALARAKASARRVAVDQAVKLVLVDGIFAPELSDLGELENGLHVQSLREVLENSATGAMAGLVLSTTDDAVISLNAAMASDGLVISIAEGNTIRRPIQIVQVATGSSVSAFTRSYLQLDKGAHATVVQSFISAEGASGYQANDVLIALAGDEASLSHIRIAADAADAVNISSGIIAVGTRAKLDLFSMTCSGSINRYQGFVTLGGEGSKLSANGVNLIKDKLHADTTIVVDHAVAHCTSRQNFRAVVDDCGRSVFQGRIVVRPVAQKIDASLSTRALLLSDQAEADSKPELEISADDVTCGHGATSGALDGNLVFYLRARGLSEKDAQMLLIKAFIGESIEEIFADNLRDFVTAQAEHWLQERQ